MDQLGPSEPYRAPMGPIVKLHSAALLPGKPCEDGFVLFLILNHCECLSLCLVKFPLLYFIILFDLQ